MNSTVVWIITAMLWYQGPGDYGYTNYEGVLGAVCSMELQNIKTFTSLLTSPTSFLFLVPDDLHFSPESFSTYF